MDPSLYVRGAILGFSIAAPVGPIGILCIRRTLAQGRAYGFASGLGAATADALYGTIAAFGLSIITNTLVSHQLWLRLIGGAFLCYLGVRTLLSRPAENEAGVRHTGRGLLGAWASTLALTITNPMTILSFVAVFAALGLGQGASGGLNAVALVAGVFTGSALWWLLLSGGVSLLRRRVTPGLLLWVNRLAGAIILAFGALALGSLVV